MLFDVLAIMITFCIAFTLAINHVIPVWLAGVIVALVVILRILRFALGGILGKTIEGLCYIGLPILSLLTFFLTFGKRDPKLFGAMAALYVMLLGFYMLFAGRYDLGSWHDAWGLPVILSVMVFILNLGMYGYVSAATAGITIGFLVIVLALRNTSGKKKGEATVSWMRTGIALGSVVLLFFILLTRSGVPPAATLSPLIALFTVIAVFMLLAKGLKG